MNEQKTEPVNNTGETYDAPRWQPDPEKYNTGYRSKQEKQKPSKKWIIPLTIVLAVLVVVIIVGVAVGANYLNKVANRSAAAEIGEVQAAETPSSEVIDGNNVVWTEVDQADASSSGIVITDVSDIVEEVFPAVVSITSRTIINNSDYFNFFFGGQGSPYGGNGEGTQKEVDSGLGSGTIIGQNDKELLILTSYHVVDEASSLAVTFVNGTSIDGVVKSADDETDIAIVSVPLEDIDEDTLSAIKTAKLSTTPAEVGEGVVVIGNPLGYGMSVTTGIVSAVDRELYAEGKTLTVLQTDAAINSGNSGGCMLNAKGEVIGISEAKITIASVEGMCYAIPISNNSELIQDLLLQETPEQTESETAEQITQGAYLGIRGRDITSDLAQAYGMPQGVYVISVVEGGGAEKAGILDGDIIIKLDGEDVSTMSKMQFELAKHNEADVVSVTVMRQEGGNYVQATIDVTLTGQLS